MRRIITDNETDVVTNWCIIKCTLLEKELAKSCYFESICNYMLVRFFYKSGLRCENYALDDAVVVRCQIQVFLRDVNGNSIDCSEN